MANTEVENASKSPSFGIMASYGTGKFLVEFYSAAFSVLLYKYYETNLHLSPLLTALAIIIYSIWNAVNDPIIGYFTIRPTRFSKKYGRRYPWIVFGCFIWIFTIIPIFILPSELTSNPEEHQLWIFLWMVGAIVIHDLFFSIWELNYQSLFPDKFRGNTIRANAAGIATFIGVFGIAIGNLLPTFIVEYEDDFTYVLNSVIFAGIALILFFLLLPGCRETPETINRYLTSIETAKTSQKPEENFFVQLRNAFKHKNFVAFILFYFLYQACTMTLTASVDYIGDYILPGEKSDTTIIFAGMLIGALISIPVWALIAVKIQSNQKALNYAALVMIVALFAMFFTPNYLGYTITITFFGMGFGGYWFLITPVMADCIDEIVVKTRKRNDGIFMGFRAFFGRLSYAVQAISFAIVHSLTQFNNLPNAEQTDIAKIGIRIHTSILPMIYMIIGVILFWRMNSLNREKMKLIHQELEQINL